MTGTSHFKILYIFNWKVVAHSIMLVSAKHQYESVTGIRMSPPLELPSHLPYPSPPTSGSCYRALVWVTWVIQRILVGIYFTYVMYVSVLLSLIHPTLSFIAVWQVQVIFKDSFSIRLFRMWSDPSICATTKSCKHVANCHPVLLIQLMSQCTALLDGDMVTGACHGVLETEHVKWQLSQSTP